MGEHWQRDSSTEKAKQISSITQTTLNTAEGSGGREELERIEEMPVTTWKLWVRRKVSSSFGIPKNTTKAITGINRK